MAFSVVQKHANADGSSTSTGSTLTIGPYTTGITSNNAVLGYCSINNTATPTITDDASPSNTYSVLYIDTVLGVCVFGLVGVTHGGGKNVTLNYGSGLNNFASGAMLEVSGAVAGSGAGGIDKVASVTGATGPGSLSSGNTATLSVSGEFLYSVVADTSGGTAQTFTAGTNVAWTKQNDQGSFTTALPMADETFSPYNSTAGIAGTWTSAGGSSQTYDVAIVTLKPAVAGAACTRLLLGVGCGIWAAKKIEENPLLTRRDLIRPRRSLILPPRRRRVA